MKIYNTGLVNDLSIQEMTELNTKYGDAFEVSAYENTIRGTYHVNF